MYWVTDIDITWESKNWKIGEIILEKSNMNIQFLHSILVAKDIMIPKTRVVIYDTICDRTSYLQERYKMMKEIEKDVIENIVAEENDDYSDDSLFNISSWGADLSFREIISMYEEDELLKPELQRKYVWDKVEASRFIESILMGLPVPSVFFAQSGSQKLIVDGYQRIMTVYDYVRGIFTTDNKIFRLSNSEKINERWRNKAFSELTTDEQRKIRSTTIHAIIFEQKKPENDDTSLYQIFERINTSGRTLTPQEIRNCVYQGTFNKMLFELNKNEHWRKLFGLATEDTRMRDIECILRFFVMKSDVVQKKSSQKIYLKKVLNEYMGSYADSETKIIEKFSKDFVSTMKAIYDNIGINAFRNYSSEKFTKKFHPAIFDAVAVAVSETLDSGESLKKVSEKQHIALLQNAGFKEAVSMRTTNIDNIKKRIKLAHDFLIEGASNEA